MDNLDIAILHELQLDARIPNSKLAEKVHLSPSAVLERVRRLRKSGIIKQFSTLLDTQALGYNLTVMMELRIERNLCGSSISKELVKFPEILEIHDVAGDCDYLLKVVARDSDSLRNTMRAIGAIPGVLSSQTKLILGTIKSELSPQIKQEKTNEK